MFGQSMNANIHKNIRFKRGTSDSSENHPENPALLKILLIKINGMIKIAKIIAIIMNSAMPIPNIFLTFHVLFFVPANHRMPKL
jgi:hypothetical protein